jgi:hypothetical protein
MKELHLTTPFLSRSEGQDYVSQRLVRLAARQMKAQVPDAWPNLFREARFLSAVDFVQSDRPRRRVAGEMARIFGEVDLLPVPSLCDEMLTIGNFTGHPSLTFRAKLRAGVGSPQRLGARSGAPAAEVLATPACAPRRDAHRAPVRRGYNRPCGRSDGARVGRVHERPAGF